MSSSFSALLVAALLPAANLSMWRLNRQSSEAAERFYALGFALEQIREHLEEVHRVVGEWAKG